MRIFPLACILLLGVGLSLIAFFFIRGNERERIEQEFEWRTRSHLEALRTNLERSEECLFTLRDLFQSATYVAPSKFRRTAEDLRQRHRGVQQLQWVARVKAEERAEFVEQAHQKGPADYDIRERNDEGNAIGHVGEHEDYAPVLYVDPQEGNEASLGYDTYRGTHQQTIYRARDTGMMTATRRIPLREPTGKEFGWACFLPVYSKGPEPTTTEERKQRLLGYAVGTFRLTDWVANSFTDSTKPTVEALFVDETPGVPERFLVAFADGVIRTPPSQGEAVFAGGLHRTERLQVGGRPWFVIFRPSPAWLAAQVTPYPHAALAVGLLITGLVTFLVSSTQRRAAVVGRLVEERTAELHATQESLREDIRRRELVEVALRKSEDRYRAFVEQSTEGVLCFEYEPPISTHLPVEEQIELMYRQARLSECNDVMAQMYGYERSEQLVGAAPEIFAPRNDPQLADYFRAFIENDYRVTDWESREVDKHGNTRFFVTNRSGIVEGGLLKRSWGTQRDVTERKREAEIQIQQATRLRLAVSAASLGTWDWDLVTQRVIWSPETERMFGLEPGTFDGKLETYMGFLYPEDRERVGIIIRHAIQTPGETGTDYELRIMRPDGTSRWIVARGAVVRDAQGKTSAHDRCGDGCNAPAHRRGRASPHGTQAPGNRRNSRALASSCRWHRARFQPISIHSPAFSGNA